MTHLNHIVDADQLARHLDAGYIARRPHPTQPLSILNYTQACQYDQAWDDTTRACRGLIFDDLTGTVLARPFPKFHNLDEHMSPHLPAIPDTPPAWVADKLDGSLGIIYPAEDGPAVATRGSFTSEQAVWATAWLRAHHPTWAPPDGVTVLCEIIYPQNRIVVDYGDRAELVGLAAVYTATGEDLSLVELGRIWPGASSDVFAVSLDRLRDAANQRANSEGFVAVWPRLGAPALRVKIKSADYVRLHKAIFGLTTRKVWEHLRHGTYDDLIDSLPDELHPWCADVADRMRADVEALAVKVGEQTGRALVIAGENATRKDIAEAIQQCTDDPSLCFAQLDGYLLDLLWKGVRPEHDTPAIDMGDDVE